MPYVEHVQWDVFKNLVLIYRKLFLKAFNQHFLNKIVAFRMVFKRNEYNVLPGNNPWWPGTRRCPAATQVFHACPHAVQCGPDAGSSPDELKGKMNFNKLH